MAPGERPALVPTVLTRKMWLGELPGSLVQGRPVCLPGPRSWSLGCLESGLFRQEVGADTWPKLCVGRCLGPWR